MSLIIICPLLALMGGVIAYRFWTVVQEHLLRIVSFPASRRSYFGVSALLLGILELAFHLRNIWGGCFEPELSCLLPLPAPIRVALASYMLGAPIYWLLLFLILPVAGVLLSLLGLMADQKKIFSNLALTLLLASFCVAVLSLTMT